MKKNKEQILELVRYLIIGVLTTVVSLAIYYGLVSTVLNPSNAKELQIANVISWIGSVLFAYITNRIFVFKSKNKNKIKELGSFVGSRVITLLMDMALMFIGVTLLHQNDKIIKLISQVAIIIANYVFSKLFVFNNKKETKKKDRSNFFLYCLLGVFLMDFIKSIWPINNYIIGFDITLKGLIFVYFFYTLFREKKHLYPLFIILGIVLIEILFAFTKNTSVMKEVYLLLNTFMLPLVLLYMGKKHNPKLDDRFLTKIFFAYLLIFLIPYVINPFHLEENYAFFYGKAEILGIIMLLLPIAYNTLKHHHNKIAKSLGIITIIGASFLWSSSALILSLLLTIIYFIWQDRPKIKKDLIFVLPMLLLTILIGAYLFPNIEQGKIDNRKNYIEYQNTVFENANLEEKIFGLGSITEIKIEPTKVDFFDIYIALGYIGFGVYILILLYTLWKLQLKSYYLYSVILMFMMSVLSGHILISASVAIWLSCLGNSSMIEKKKRVLLVSNMYPSKKNKHYGSFVKNTKEELDNLNFAVDKVTMSKKENIVEKVLAYLRFYIIAFLSSIFQSYDYIYVHFASHSAFPILLGKITSTGTSFICNVHGNDVVPDYDFEKKNVERSKKVLKYADKVVVPSLYFKEVMMKNYQIPEKKIWIYPSGGVNFEQFKVLDKQECRQKLGLEEDKFYIGFVSRIEKDKGWDTLLKALNILKEEPFMKNVRLIILGSGSEQKELERLITQFNLKDKIIQKDFVSQKNLVNYYNAFDLFIFPTRRKSESLGLVGLEAMATKTFTIICNTYGPREYAKEKETALTFQEDKDGKVLASKIKKFMKMKDQEKNVIIDQAYQKAKEYDKTNLIHKLKEIFQDE